MAYTVKVDQFEGPLDLLLVLIEEQKLDITMLSLAQVTDQYLAYVKGKKQISLQNLSEFLTVATRLILIKSKALLPLLELEDEEEKEIHDLQEQLAVLKMFVDSAEKIEILLQRSHRSFSREGYSGVEAVFCPPENMRVFDLQRAYRNVLQEMPSPEKLREHILQEVMSLEEKIAQVQKMICTRAVASFSELAKSAKDKIEIVLSFLALLELIKQEVIVARQQGIFGEITLHSMASHKQSMAKKIK